MSAERLGVFERKTKHRTLDHYRRHAELYGPEGVLAAAVDELSAEDVEALSRFVRRRTKARVEDADTLARRVAVLRGERETLNVLVDRASSTNEAERLIRERDGIARRIERCEEELKVAQAACAGYSPRTPIGGAPHRENRPAKPQSGVPPVLWTSERLLCKLRKDGLHAEVTSAVSAGVPPRSGRDGPLGPQGFRSRRGAWDDRAVAAHMGQAEALTGMSATMGSRALSARSCGRCAERTRGSSRSVTCSNEPRPSSPRRPIGGERVPDDRGGEGHGGRPGLPCV